MNPVMPRGFIPTVQPYSHNGPAGAVRTEVGGGRPRYALEFDRGVQQYQVTLLLDSFKYAVWVTFYHRIIALGAISFTMTLDSGYGRQPHLVNIVPGSYNVTTTGGNFEVVTFTVEAESTAYDLTDEEAVAILEYYELFGSDRRLIDRIAQFANVDSLVLNF